MNIAVCICQVPDTASVVGFVDGVLDLSRINAVINPYDEYALEEAVRFRERFDGSQVTVFSVAPVSAKEVLRKALAMGADRTVLVDDTGISEPFHTALALSRAMTAFYTDSRPDMIFCGKHSTDFQSAQVPAMLGELLGIASVCGVVAVQSSGEGLQAEREIEGGIEYVDVRFPVLLSAEKGLNIPRKTTVRGVMEARKKTIDVYTPTFHEPPHVLMTGIRPIERKKQCRFVSDEKALVQILAAEGILF